MRLALQALFAATEANEEGAARRALLERRLRANERSAGFFRRLRGVVDDESLSAPEVFAEESFPDANVVGEYLDAQTTPEVARAYEDACWDSPEMLAEIGRCCDILNNEALNNVVAPKNCRRRLYYIAWEEGVANDAPTENDSIVTNFTPPTPPEEANEASPSEVAQSEKTFQEENRERNATKTKRRKEKKSLKSTKPAKTVRAALAEERSWGRRAKRAAVRLAFATSFLASGYCAWQMLGDANRSETFQIKTATQELVVANNAAEPNVSEETSLRPTTISSSNLGEILTSPSEEIVLNENDALADLSSPLAEGMEPLKLAALPKLTNEAEATVSEPSTNVEGRTRVGLGGEEHWNRRPPLEIPSRNNDVFGGAKLLY